MVEYGFVSVLVVYARVVVLWRPVVSRGQFCADERPCWVVFVYFVDDKLDSVDWFVSVFVVFVVSVYPFAYDVNGVSLL